LRRAEETPLIVSPPPASSPPIRFASRARPIRGAVGALLGVALSTGAWLACSEGGGSEASGSAAAQRGRKLYENVCIACHNADPKQDGSLGPALAGASLELLEAKVLRGEYPPGYTPARPTHAMPRFEYLKDRLGDIAAYLQQD
jgi:mono/diheme cytochrome c family protein